MFCWSTVEAFLHPFANPPANRLKRKPLLQRVTNNGTVKARPTKTLISIPNRYPTQEDRKRRRHRSRSPSSQSHHRYDSRRHRSNSRSHNSSESDDYDYSHGRSRRHGCVHRRRRRRSPLDENNPPRRDTRRRNEGNSLKTASPRRRSESEDRKRRLRRRRRKRARGPSVPNPAMSPANAAPKARPAGLVSDDDGVVDSSRSPRKERRVSPKGSGASSIYDDSKGHFQGGPGTVISDRYRVVRDVGLGTFGRVVECLDLNHRSRRRRNDNGAHVAIKIVRKIKRYYDSAVIEANIIDDINRRGGRGMSHCAIMFDAFAWSSHYCMVFENLGPSLYDFMKKHRYQPFPYVCVRDFAEQLLETIDFLHSFGLIHTDLKPENILLMNHHEVTYRNRRRACQIPQSTRIKVIDFGCATYDDGKKSTIVNTRQYRAPEVILGIGWGKPTDLWSIGCILMELYMGDLLFPTHDNVEHLFQMEGVLGPFPRRILREARKSKLATEAFDPTGKHREDKVLSPESVAFVRDMVPLQALVRREDDRLLQLVRRLLVIDPHDRGTAYECLRYKL